MVQQCIKRLAGEKILSKTILFQNMKCSIHRERVIFEENALSELNSLTFSSYSKEWLDFIMRCRSGRDESSYELVLGGIANDKVFNTVELYLDHLIDEEEAIKRLRFEKPKRRHWLSFIAPKYTNL